MSDLVPLGWWERLAESEDTLAYDGTLSFATALVRDGVSGVTVVIPRAPGVVLRARAIARAADVVVQADQVGSHTITLRFSCQAVDQPQPPNRGLRWLGLRRWLGRRGAAGP